MRSRLLPIVLLGAAACGPATDGPAQRGFATARRDIADGHVRLRTLGFPCDSNSGLDPDTGLVRETDGCLGSSDDPERAAYNAELVRAARAGEIDRFLFRDRVRTQEEVTARLAGATLVEEGKAASLLDGRFHAELSAYSKPAVPDAAGPRELSVYETGDPKVRISMCTFGVVTLAIDPDGRTLLVGHDHRIKTFDLATGTGLQSFHLPR
jgi:hypothetical protein